MTREERIDSFGWIMESVMPTPELKKLTVRLTEIGFFDKPASLKYHGTETGDLYRHSAADVPINLHFTKHFVHPQHRKLCYEAKREEKPSPLFFPGKPLTLTCGLSYFHSA